MFDYVQRLQLALSDTARRTAMKVVAGVVLAVGAGFLLAALWSWLAYRLGWGATLASLAIGGGFVVIALILLAAASKPRHEMPTSDDLKREVEARVNLVADAAADRARQEAGRVMDMAGNKVTSLMDQASYRANKFANDAERRVYSTARETAEKVGLTPENVEAAKRTFASTAETTTRAANSNAGSMAKLIGAFAIGIALANRLRGDRDDDDDLA